VFSINGAKRIKPSEIIIGETIGENGRANKELVTYSPQRRGENITLNEY
jgi:hypothetical protein